MTPSKVPGAQSPSACLPRLPPSLSRDAAWQLARPDEATAQADPGEVDELLAAERTLGHAVALFGAALPGPEGWSGQPLAPISGPAAEVGQRQHPDVLLSLQEDNLIGEPVQEGPPDLQRLVNARHQPIRLRAFGNPLQGPVDLGQQGPAQASTRCS